jgi:hypothetical protein
MVDWRKRPESEVNMTWEVHKDNLSAEERKQYEDFIKRIIAFQNMKGIESRNDLELKLGQILPETKDKKIDKQVDLFAKFYDK